jgi:ribonucleoside-diphosphate reductase alpha chain
MEVGSNSIGTIVKRDGTVVSFNPIRIKAAIEKALRATDEKPELSESLTMNVINLINERYGHNGTIKVEDCQDIVEESLMRNGPTRTARAYISYRNEHNKLRMKNKTTSKEMKELCMTASKYFQSIYEQIVYLRTYSRWIPEKSRREMWPETVQRYLNFMKERLGDTLTKEEYDEIYEAILKMDVMPSMRLLQFAGAAARSNNMFAYNCCFIAPTCISDLRDIMFICMCGTGVGWSVESKFSNKFPEVAYPVHCENIPTHIVEDSKEGWCNAFYEALDTWWNKGKQINFDYSLVRPAGAPLKKTGGKASGPEPLRELLEFTKLTLEKYVGKKLPPIELHDIICKIGRIVVVGGVRRSAMISLSDLEDEDIRKCKQGNFYQKYLHRCMANNSAVYNEIPSDFQLLSEWTALVESKSGERGIFNRSNLKDILPERRVKILGDRIKDMGCNPCGEIILQSHGLCNLSTAVCRPSDTEETLLKKIRLATIIGTYQATLTDFNYVSPKFKQIAEEERLLGVSLAGQQDCEAVRSASVLQSLKNYAIQINEEYAKRFGITASTCVTTVKPDGTLGAITGVSCGIHAAYDRYYIRRVRFSIHDPVAKLLRDQGVPYNVENPDTNGHPTTYVFEFPLSASSNSVLRSDMSAIQSLEYWKLVKINYTEHNPSVTISVKDNEWIDVLLWIKNNWKYVGGLSFLPYSDHIYHLAPYETITQDSYNHLKSTFPIIDFSKLPYYEKEDCTDVKKEAACIGGSCALE